MTKREHPDWFWWSMVTLALSGIATGIEAITASYSWGLLVVPLGAPPIRPLLAFCLIWFLRIPAKPPTEEEKAEVRRNPKQYLTHPFGRMFSCAMLALVAWWCST